MQIRKHLDAPKFYQVNPVNDVASPSCTGCHQRAEHPTIHSLMQRELACQNADLKLLASNGEGSQGRFKKFFGIIVESPYRNFVAEGDFCNPKEVIA